MTCISARFRNAGTAVVCGAIQSRKIRNLRAKNEMAFGRRPISSLPVLPRLALIGSKIGSKKRASACRRRTSAAPLKPDAISQSDSSSDVPIASELTAIAVSPQCLSPAAGIVIGAAGRARFESGTSSRGGLRHSRLRAKARSKVCCSPRPPREGECPRAARTHAIASTSMCPGLPARRGRGRARYCWRDRRSGLQTCVGAQERDGRGEEP